MNLRADEEHEQDMGRHENGKTLLYAAQGQHVDAHVIMSLFELESLFAFHRGKNDVAVANAWAINE